MTAASFHTTAARYAKKGGGGETPKYREAKSAKMKKKKPVDRPRPPPVGERKALRKRIVLSNPNALEVDGMQDLSAENIGDSRLRSSVAGLPVSMLDQLRAVQAFQTKQGWSIFRRPGTVMRNESLEMGRLFNDISGESDGKGKVVKKVVTGVRGAGKSVYLLQAMAMGFLKDWVVFTVPEREFLWFCVHFALKLQLLMNCLAQDLINAHTGYAPLDESKPTVYVQNEATAALLSRTVAANGKVLSGLKVSQKHPALESVVQPGMTLDGLARLGMQDPAIAWTVFQALWTELTATGPAAGFEKDFKSRPPLLVTVDGLSHWMKDTEYRSADFKPIHAHDLVFVNHFLSLLKPGNNKPTLPNGGMLLYATTASNSPSIYSFEVALEQLAARTNGLDRTNPRFPHADPYLKPDNRVLKTFAAPKSNASKEGQLQLQTLAGLSRAETRGFMEYFARSGLLRENINEQWVGEKWTLSSGGVIGELEKLGRRVRVIA